MTGGSHSQRESGKGGHRSSGDYKSDGSSGDSGSSESTLRISNQKGTDSHRAWTFLNTGVDPDPKPEK